MELEQDDIDGTAVLRVSGRLDMVAAPQFKAAVEDVVAGGSPRVVVDLGATSFIDSSGLGAVISGLRAARQAGGDLRLAGAAGQVEQAMQLMKLDKMFGRYATVQDAIDAGG